MYLFIKLTKWYAKEIDSVEADLDNINAHISNGDIIGVGDDIETFADAVGVSKEDIEVVD